jgi:hypothetical protein
MKAYNKRLREIWNSNLVKSIRINHASLTNIAEYERYEAWDHDSDVNIKESFNL